MGDFASLTFLQTGGCDKNGGPLYKPSDCIPVNATKPNPLPRRIKEEEEKSIDEIKKSLKNEKPEHGEYEDPPVPVPEPLTHEERKRIPRKRPTVDQRLRLFFYVTVTVLSAYVLLFFSCAEQAVCGLYGLIMGLLSLWCIHLETNYFTADEGTDIRLSELCGYLFGFTSFFGIVHLFLSPSSYCIPPHELHTVYIAQFRSRFLS